MRLIDRRLSVLANHWNCGAKKSGLGDMLAGEKKFCHSDS